MGPLTLTTGLALSPTPLHAVTFPKRGWLDRNMEEQRMIPYAAYKVLHLIGVMFLLLSLGAYLMLSMNKPERGRKLAAITHGISVLIILVAGFGLLARLGLFGADGWPVWVWVKLIIWLILAAIVTFIKRVPGLTPVLWFLIPALAGLAAYMAVYKIDF